MRGQNNDDVHLLRNRELKEMTEQYTQTAIVTHQGFAAFMVQGPVFGNCEWRRYRFVDDNAALDLKRVGRNIDSGLEQGFGPTLLVEVATTNT